MLRRGTGFSDSSLITVMCLDCRRESTSRLGELRHASTIKCGSCGSDIRIEGRLLQDLELFQPRSSGNSSAPATAAGK
jgi:hypothetical protein